MNKEKKLKNIMNELEMVINKHACNIETDIMNIRKSKCRTVGNAEKGLKKIAELEDLKNDLNNIGVNHYTRYYRRP